jgi:hypothetical protein
VSTSVDALQAASELWATHEYLPASARTPTMTGPHSASERAAQRACPHQAAGDDEAKLIQIPIQHAWAQIVLRVWVRQAHCHTCAAQKHCRIRQGLDHKLCSLCPTQRSRANSITALIATACEICCNRELQTCVHNPTLQTSQHGMKTCNNVAGSA